MRRLFDRLGIGNSTREPSQIVILLCAALGLGSVAFLLYLGVAAQKGIPGRSYYYVNVVADDADSLRPYSRVRIGAVDVGQVLSTDVEKGRAVLQLQLSADYAPLRADTRAGVRPDSAVGFRFLELTPGTKGPFLPEGGTIPQSQVTTQVSSDRIFDIFDHQRRARARTLLNELGIGFFGRGDDANLALRDIPPTLRHLQRVSEAINDRGGFGPLVSAAQGAAHAAEPVREDIAFGFRPQHRTLGVFVRERRAVQAIFEEAPPTERAVQDDLPRVEPLLREVTRFSEALVPALEVGGPTLEDTAVLLEELRPGLREAPAALANLREAAPVALRVLRTLEPVLPGLDELAESALPIVDEFAPRRCDLRRWTDSWSNVLSYGDDFSSYLRFNLQFDPSSIGGLNPPSFGEFRSPYPDPCEIDRQEVNEGERAREDLDDDLDRGLID